MMDTHKEDYIATKLGLIIIDEGLTPPEGVLLLRNMIKVLEEKMRERI